MENLHREPREIVLADFLAAFPSDAGVLRLLCNEVGFPLGFTHPALLGELAGFSSAEILAELRTPYVCFSAYYFLLDSVVDDHRVSPLDPLYLTHLLTLAVDGLFTALKSFPDSEVQAARRILYSHIARNADAVRTEYRLHNEPLCDEPALERESIIGRSTSFILFYDLLCLLSKSPVHDGIRECLESLIYYIQLGDDLCDWEADFKNHRLTTFIRSCYRLRGRPLALHEMEELVYCQGIYESQLADVISGLRSISRRLEELISAPHTLILEYIAKHTSNLHAALIEALQIKAALRCEEISTLH